MSFRFGFQTYTWQMSYAKYRDALEHILAVIRASGGEAVEPEVCMLGKYTHDPAALQEAVERHGLQLGALCLALPWQGPEETPEERAEAERVIRFLGSFPGTVLTLAQLPGEDRRELQTRQRHALVNINAIAERAADAGIVCAFHPNSPAGSVFRIEEDYRILFEGLDARYCGYAPDTGHIANGAMEVLDIFRTYRSLIRHVHFKDRDAVTGAWSAMGQGRIDHEGIVRYLRETSYEGWIMVEEESVQAETDPDGVTRANGQYLQSQLAKL